MDIDGHELEDGRPAPRERSTAGGGLAIEGQRAPRDVRRFSHEAMASVFEVYSVHPDARYAAQAAHAAFDLVDRLERDLSRFLPNSDIGRVNHLAAGESTRVSASTMECLVIARHVFALTGGAFDVSIGTGLPSLELDPDDLLGLVLHRGGDRCLRVEEGRYFASRIPAARYVELPGREHLPFVEKRGALRHGQ